MFGRATALAAAVCFISACADAPQKRSVASANGGSASADDGPLGNEPGGRKAKAACISLGLEKDTGAPDPSIKRDVTLGQRELERATSLFDQGDYSGALAAYTLAAGSDPYNGLAHLGVAESHLYTDNDTTKMRESLLRALVLLPTNPRAHLRAGEVAAETGEKQRAEAHLKCALELRADYPEAQLRLAKYLYVEQRYAEAEAVLASAKVQDLESLILSADIYEAEKKYREAAEKVEAAADLAKGSAPLWRRAASLYESAGNVLAAKKARATADKIDPPQKERNLRPLQKSKRSK